MEYKDLTSVCKALREKRKKLNLSLEKVSSHTKLSPAILRRIETEDRLESMNQVYLKGFIKLYASFLEEEDIVKNLDNIFYASPPAAEEEKKTRKEIRFSWQDILYFLAKVAVLTIFIAGAGVAVRHFASRRRVHALKPPPAAEKKKLPPASAAAVRKASPLKLILALRAKSEVFLRVKVDGEEVFRDTVSGGVRDSWEGKKEIVIYINNPSLVEMEFNGERIRTDRRRPATYIFTSQGFRTVP